MHQISLKNLKESILELEKQSNNLKVGDLVSIILLLLLTLLFSDSIRSRKSKIRKNANWGNFV
jgi:hypothetical protein